VTQRGASLLAAALVLLSVCGGATCSRRTDETAALLHARAASGSPTLRAFYEARGFAPAWTDARDRRSLHDALAAADRHGLDPKAYGVDRLASAQPADGEQLAPQAVVARDLLFTKAFVDYAGTLAHGKRPTAKNAVDPQVLSALQQAAASHAVGDVLERLAPQQPGYRQLCQALKRYRDLAAGGDWPLVPIVTAAAADAIRNRLAAEGLSDLRAFQVRRGLPPTGRVDDATQRALSVPAQARVTQIEANLERWRRLPRDLGKRYVWVNLADFTLAAYDGGSRVLEMKVIVGSQYNPTPAFFDRMAYVIFNPYWLIPSSIARDEIVPKGPRFMQREGIKRGSDGRLRQAPGPRNPLGRIKFMFPNQFDVYLHDTPKAALFRRRDRTLSHGCVRLERPIDLAEFVLAPGGWTREQIVAAIESGKNQRVDVADPVPVYILYWTAWVDSDGTVEFRDDVYGYDQALEQELTVEASRQSSRDRDSDG
jgi:L,D-transpeptidase YcbB